jgi:hypothetical protein
MTLTLNRLLDFQVTVQLSFGTEWRIEEEKCLEKKKTFQLIGVISMRHTEYKGNDDIL